MRQSEILPNHLMYRHNRDCQPVTQGTSQRLSKSKTGFAWFRFLALATLLVIAILPPPVMAADTLGQLNGLCSGQETNIEYKDCLYKRFLVEDQELNRVWKRVIAEIRRSDYLEPKLRKKWENRLRQAQRNWVSFKDVDCKDAVLYEWWGGSGAGGAISLCLIRHTMLRTENLKERYFSR